MSDDRDLRRDIAEEDDLRRLLRHGDGDLRPPTFAAIEREARSGRGRLAPLNVAAAALVVVVAVVAAGWLGRTLADRAATDDPPAPPAPPAAADSPYGVLVRTPAGRLRVLRETDGAAVASLDRATAVFAVSPDGRELAYVPGPDRSELWIVRARDLGGARRVLALSDELGVGVVWSPDSRSLMLAAASKALAPTPIPGPAYTALRVVGRDGSGARELARIATGQHVSPLAWDPTRDLAAAEEGAGQKGPGRYLLVSPQRQGTAQAGLPPNVRAFELPGARDPQVTIGSLVASPIPPQFVMAPWRLADGREVIRFWPLDQPEPFNIRELAAPGERLPAAVWRPTWPEIAVSLAGGIELWSLAGERRSLGDAVATQVAAVRFDGTALYSFVRGEQPPHARITVLPPGPVTRRDVAIGDATIVGSVRLADPPPPPPRTPPPAFRPPATGTPLPAEQHVVHTNPALGYRIALPPGYRRVISAIEGERVGFDYFVPRTEAEERAICDRQRAAGGGPRPPERVDDVHVTVHENAERLSPVDFAGQPNRRLVFTRVERVTVNGHEAAKVVHERSGDTASYVISANDRLYEVETASMMQPSPHSQGWLDRIVSTFRTIPWEPAPLTPQAERMLCR